MTAPTPMLRPINPYWVRVHRGTDQVCPDYADDVIAAPDYADDVIAAEDKYYGPGDRTSCRLPSCSCPADSGLEWLLVDPKTAPRDGWLVEPWPLLRRR